MQKEFENPNPKRQKPDEIAADIADIFNVSTSYVRKVRDGERDQEEIFNAYMTVKDGYNKLLDAVRAAVPI